MKGDRGTSTRRKTVKGCRGGMVDTEHQKDTLRLYGGGSGKKCRCAQSRSSRNSLIRFSFDLL